MASGSARALSLRCSQIDDDGLSLVNENRPLKRAALYLIVTIAGAVSFINHDPSVIFKSVDFPNDLLNVLDDRVELLPHGHARVRRSPLHINCH